MSRRSPKSTVPSPARSKTRPADLAVVESDPDTEFALWIGERLRRLALGATVALLTVRAFWPSEPDYREDAGGGMFWVFAMTITVGLAIASSLAGGVVRLRWSWADLGVILLVAAVALSATHASDRRPAINLAWEWVAVGFAYLILRNLPRTRGETTAIAGALVAVAAAVAMYGLDQVVIELPLVRAHYLADPARALALVGIEPGTSRQVAYENRLLGSNEPYSTFALANSLAGFLLAPLVVMIGTAWESVVRPGGKGGRLAALAMGAVPASLVLICLVLTKSRSAYVGLTVGLFILAWRERRRVPKRTLLIAAASACALAVVLAVAGLATGRLDRQVFTESGKSLGYRQQYWIGAWRAINAKSSAFWAGYGPGNFAAPYVLHKLPDASEEITDPHNIVLEVWSTAGLWGVLFLTLAVAALFRDTLGPGRGEIPDSPGLDGANDMPPPRPAKDDPSAPPVSATWLLLSASAGWGLLTVFRLGDFFDKDMLSRWIVLGVGWWLAVGLGAVLWRRRPLDGSVFGAAAVALLVNLLAAGGIGFPSVALMLWGTAAVGLNLRDDRPCGRLREPGGRVFAFGLMAVWVALLGTFVGAVTPYWKAEAALAQAEELSGFGPRPPDFDRAEAAYKAAAVADIYSARPWQGLARMELTRWRTRGSRFEDQHWKKIPILLLDAVSPPRPKDVWGRHLERAVVMQMLLAKIGKSLPPMELARYQANVVEASRNAVLLYPTNASLRARLAEASAEIGMKGDAGKEGHEALRLDALMKAHTDRQLDPKIRLWIESHLAEWDAAAKEAVQIAKPPGKGKPKP